MLESISYNKIMDPTAHLLISLILAIVGGWLAYYLGMKAKMDAPLCVIIGIAVAIVILIIDVPAALGLTTAQ